MPVRPWSIQPRLNRSSLNWSRRIRSVSSSSTRQRERFWQRQRHGGSLGDPSSAQRSRDLTIHDRITIVPRRLVNRDISRRDILRWTAVGAGAAPLAAVLASCSATTDRAAPADTGDTAGAASIDQPPVTNQATTPSPSTPTTSSANPTTSDGAATPSASATTVFDTTPTSAPSTTAVFDTTRRWWLQGNFAPVLSEVQTDALEVSGAIPPELSGMYVRNGSNPQHVDSPHWFFGDGMLHGIRIADGKAMSYRNRYVRTTMYEADAGFGQGAPGGAANQSNVSCIWHGGKLMTSGEVGFPYEVERTDLSTVGPYDFAGKLTTAFTAHPKIDPSTGRMHSFGYGFTAPFLTYHITEPDGTLVHSEVVDIPRSTMMHDFAITETDAVFWDLPVTFDLQAAIAYVADPTTAAFPYAWNPDAGSRVGVMPLSGGAASIRWFDLEPCYVFHGVNAFRRADEVIVDVCRLSSMFAEGELFGGTPTHRRWTLNTSTGAVRDDILAEHDPGDLPSRDPRRLGRPLRYSYLVSSRENPLTVDFGGVIKHDYSDNSREFWDPGPRRHSGEWLFVPAGSDVAEDAGYLLSVVHDEATNRSELSILDATDVRRGPVATIMLPQRVPYGFHGAWIPH